ncbi:ImuA family protein [Zavarzinia compransoris]|uniref:Protein ImuA n=1 Tax=Zavarzinia compransoris TaxID=1264899 RepID=A0A317ECE5_9PROT|nr:hypothetical protein [Zavarzinia compransoris]PWR23800.1 hypothetical protein DKG75_04355 [Zavarzinia compransoris]
MSPAPPFHAPGGATPSCPRDALRRQIARIERAAPGGAPPPVFAPFGIAALDDALGGGLVAGALHEFAGPAGAGLGLRLAGERGALVWAGPAEVFRDQGLPYGPGLAGLGLDSRRLLLVATRNATDALWAAEEALRCPSVAAVVAELPGDGPVADLTATRRLSLAAREGGGLGLLVRHRAFAGTSAAATRWTVAPVPGPLDGWGGLGAAAFDLDLTRNRRGPVGRWSLAWRRDERCFTLAAPSLDLAAVPAHRPHPPRPGAVLPLRRAG